LQLTGHKNNQFSSDNLYIVALLVYTVVE
jgi:hypothetical protein